MGNIRDLGRKINSLQNIQKVTRAMNMIASIKLRKLYEVQGALELFSREADEMKVNMLGAVRGIKHPVTEGYENVKKVHLVVFTADKGLCGTHNSAVLNAVNRFIKEKNADEIEVEITSIGRKGTKFSRRKDLDIYKSFETSENSFSKNRIGELSGEVFKRFLSGEIQQIFLAGNIFYSTLRQETEILQVLPLVPPDDNTPAAGVQCEPPAEEMAVTAAPLYLKYKIQSFLLNSLLSEHASRMTAMENATSNSEDLINKYVAIQNHARQSAITNELIEIVSGKEALKG